VPVFRSLGFGLKEIQCNRKDVRFIFLSSRCRDSQCIDIFTRAAAGMVIEDELLQRARFNPPVIGCAHRHAGERIRLARGIEREQIGLRLATGKRGSETNCC